MELRSQLTEQVFIAALIFLVLRLAAQRGGDDLRQGGQTLKDRRVRLLISFGTVGQLLHPVEHAGGQLLGAHRTFALQFLRLGG